MGEYPGRAAFRARGGLFALLEELRQAKINQDDLPLGGLFEVGRFDIPVDDGRFAIMQVCQPLRRL